MKKHALKLFTLAMVFTLVLAACGGNNSNNNTANNANNSGSNTATEDNNSAAGSDAGKTIKLAYVAWDSEIASTNVIKTVLETKLDMDVELMQVDAGPMWSGIANGSADAMVAGWLPSTHQSYLDEYKDDVVDLGPNLDGTKTGLVVPTYMDITSIEDLLNSEVGEQVDYTITGIEPGAGIMMATETALTEYGLEDWTLLESSSAAMAKELESAYNDEEPIIVTGWTPHWKFAKFDLKYLEDPKGVYGGAEQIHTVVRKGLEEDLPQAYKVLDQFEWTPADMEAVMIEIFDGATPEDAAANWVEANEDKVNEWLK
ncbi:glycine betaine ABC transporter substrate-binding protein [Marinicrinis lubricantis]|uniref:Glycine betaine ABC transporter substrate-binding protein n=1 Tax=Marinicrinis lubricantis TaxID=2086470 RepID=A0ABW1INN7_9BACL